jgi:hypothetical protein
LDTQLRQTKEYKRNLQRQDQSTQTSSTESEREIQSKMIHKHSLQTAAAFDRIDDALRGKTDDDLNELIEDLDYLLYKAKEIQDISASFQDGSDYDPKQYCEIPTRF